VSAATIYMPDDESARYTRFRALMTWLESLGVCTCCRVGMAIERVEIETGDKSFKAQQLPCKPTRDADGVAVPCRDRANAARATMPKRSA
jgi:hypothetical protein